jgi:hypothetical protein
MAVEFALVRQAQTPAFLFMTVVGLVDLVAGVSIGARERPSDIVLEGPDRAAA